MIDNGRTLESNEQVKEIVKILSEKEKLDIIPNRNVGASGGFTRGMMEILNREEKDGYSHILLMEDDAVIQPDLLVRLYGFLTVLKEEWKDMTVGGMLLRLEKQEYSFSAGQWWENGKKHPEPVL